jgi:hypothetical protein
LGGFGATRPGRSTRSKIQNQRPKRITFVSQTVAPFSSRCEPLVSWPLTRDCDHGEDEERVGHAGEGEERDPHLAADPLFNEERDAGGRRY